MKFMEVEGLRILTPYSWEYENYKVAVSYKTVLVYKYGQNVGSFYPSRRWDDANSVGKMIREWCDRMPEDIATEIGEKVLNVVVFED